MVQSRQELPVKSDSTRQRSNLLAVNVGLAANIILAVLKTTIGILGHSQALLADGINSTSDVVYGFVVAIFIRLSNKPADREHPFGHNQLESIAALTISAFVMTTAVGIFWDAVNTIYDQLTGVTTPTTARMVALWVALLTVILKIGLFLYTRRIGKQQNSIAVTALAYDHRNDIFSAGAALAGITLGRMGFAWVDPLAAALVALVILRTGIQILRESADDLMDTLPGKEIEKQVVDILQLVPGIREVESIHMHRFGPYIVMNLTICVDGEIRVTQGDAIATLAEQMLKERIEMIRGVHIHYHPVQNCSD
jgi:cation diffusion facilitator family transporter